MPDNYADYPHKEALVDLTNWNWRGTGPYVLTFVAKDPNGNIVARSDRTITVGQSQTLTQQATANTRSSQIVLGKKLYVDPDSKARQQADQWKTWRTADATTMSKIADNAQAVWLGNWSSDADTAKLVQKTTAAAEMQNAVPTFVLYDIPQRDCGSYSAGGSNGASGYRSWISNVANAIGDKSAIVILEPDALAQSDCLSSNDRENRLSLISDAVSTLKSKKNVSVYIDAGHPGWKSTDDMASLLKKAGVSKADGFSLNVSNYGSTDSNVAYGTELSGKVGDKHFVIDTSRNGNGSNGEWCNPWGRALGDRPTTSTGKDLVDAYLWIKNPGESDGACNGGPSAGNWWGDYALDLAKNARWQ